MAEPDDAPRPVIHDANQPVTIEGFHRSDLIFDMDGDLGLKYDGQAEEGAVLVVLNVDGEGFDRVTVEQQHASLEES